MRILLASRSTTFTNYLGALLLAVALTSCTSNAPTPPSPTSTWSFQLAPRSCPIGIGETGVGLGTIRLSGRGAILQAMGGHVPYWLPSGFGLAGAWSEASPQEGEWAIWTDERCRMITVSYSPADGNVQRDWILDYDTARACGNHVLGMGRCIGYTRYLARGRLVVQAIGLAPIDAKHVIRSIPS